MQLIGIPYTLQLVTSPSDHLGTAGNTRSYSPKGSQCSPPIICKDLPFFTELPPNSLQKLVTPHVLSFFQILPLLFVMSNNFCSVVSHFLLSKPQAKIPCLRTLTMFPHEEEKLVSQRTACGYLSSFRNFPKSN